MHFYMQPNVTQNPYLTTQAHPYPTTYMSHPQPNFQSPHTQPQMESNMLHHMHHIRSAFPLMNMYSQNYSMNPVFPSPQTIFQQSNPNQVLYNKNHEIPLPGPSPQAFMPCGTVPNIPLVA